MNTDKGLLRKSLLARAVLPQRLLRTRVPGSVAAAARATLVPTVLTSGSSSVDGSSVATASFTPEANRVVYAFVVSNVAATGIPTASGNGLTWVQVATRPHTTNNRRLTVFRALGATPSAGTLTFDWAGVSQTSFVWSVVQFAGADTSGTDGSGATVQYNDTQFDNAGVVTAALTLPGALENAANAMLVGVALATNATVTHDGDFAELSDNAVASATNTLAVQWAIGATTCDPTWASSTYGAISIEVKSAVA